jgi:hypothetical protein
MKASEHIVLAPTMPIVSLIQATIGQTARVLPATPEMAASLIGEQVPETVTIATQGKADAAQWSAPIRAFQGAGIEVYRAETSWTAHAANGDYDAARAALDGRTLVEPLKTSCSIDLSILEPTRNPPPAMPLAGFGKLAVWIESAAKARGAPVDYVAATALVMCSTAIGTTRSVTYHDWSEFPILWVALVGFPSDGKSPALNLAHDVAREIEAEAAIGFETTRAAWEAEAEAAQLRHDRWKENVETAVEQGYPPPPRPSDAVAPQKPARPRLLIADATIEAIQARLAGLPRGLATLRDELSGWIGSFDRYGGGGGADRAFMLEAYGGNAYTVDRKKDDEPLRIPFCALNVVGGIQPDKLDMIFGGGDDGFASRFMFVWPDRVPYARVAVGPGVAPLVRAVRRLYGLRHHIHDDQPRPVALRLSAAAVEVLEQWRADLSTQSLGEGGALGAALGKMPGRAMRLALTFELCIWAGGADGVPEPTEISGATMGAVVSFLATYAVPMLRRALGEAGLPQMERDATSIARRIAKERPRLVNASTIRRQRWLGNAPAKRYAEALGELVEMGWFVPAGTRDGETSGRRRSDFRVVEGLYAALDASSWGRT